MRVLFDQGTPVPLRDSLQQHEISTAFERGWSELKNGELLDTAEREGFAVLVTTDTKLKFQQNPSGRRIAILALLTTSWPRIERATAEVVKAIAAATPTRGSTRPVPAGFARLHGRSTATLGLSRKRHRSGIIVSLTESEASDVGSN